MLWQWFLLLIIFQGLINWAFCFSADSEKLDLIIEFRE